MSCLRAERELPLLAIDVCNGKGPAGEQIDSRCELDKERRQKLPVPAKQVSEDASQGEIEHVIGGRHCAFHYKGKDHELKQVSDDRQNHSGSQARSGGDFDCIAGLRGLPIPEHGSGLIVRRGDDGIY